MINKIRRIIYAVIIFTITVTAFMGCCTHRHNVSGSSWDNASLVAEQRIIIEQQQSRFEYMERIVDEVQSNLGRAVDAVIAGIDGNTDIQNQFAVIDQFVRSVIEGKRRLENIQLADSGTDAGER